MNYGREKKRLGAVSEGDESSGRMFAWRIEAISIAFPINRPRIDAALSTASPGHLIGHAPKAKLCSSPFSTQPTTKKASYAQNS